MGASSFDEGVRAILIVLALALWLLATTRPGDPL